MIMAAQQPCMYTSAMHCAKQTQDKNCQDE